MKCTYNKDMCYWAHILVSIRRKRTTRYAGEAEKVKLMRRKEEPPMIE